MEAKVELRKGGLEAVVTGITGTSDLEATTQVVLDQLRQLGVSGSGVRAELVKAALSASHNGGQSPDGVVVARGEAPQPGINGRIVPDFPIRDTPPGDGTDPFSAYLKNVVYPGQTLLQKTPPSPGIPGKSLLGTPLAAPDGVDVPVIPGAGVTVNEDETVFTAAAYGVALFHRSQLKVRDALHVSEDRMEARLTVLPDPNVDEAGHAAKLVSALGTLEVTDGLDQEAIATAVRRARETGQPCHDAVVARGKEPVDGREVGYELLLDFGKKIGKELEGGRIDFREAEVVKNISVGDPLARVIPGIEPVAGYRVDGTPLRPKLERFQGLKPGQNTTVSEDGLHIVAESGGMVVLKGDKFHVADEYLVQGDVDYRTGNIRATGAVRIVGQVKPGFQVIGGREVEIQEDVEEAVVEAGGDLTVRGGITAGSTVKAGGKVVAKYVQNSSLEAEGDVEVKLSVTNSKVFTCAKVTALGSQGVLVGGLINAALGIEARTIGSPSSKTHVAVGVDLRVLRQIEEIDKERADRLEEIKTIQSSLGQNFLKDPRAALAAMPAGFRKGKLELLQRMKEAYQKDTDLKAQRDMLAQFDQELRKAQIAVQGEIHAGTEVTVSVARTTLAETLRRVVLYYDSEKNQVAWRKL